VQSNNANVCSQDGLVLVLTSGVPASTFLGHGGSGDLAAAFGLDSKREEGRGLPSGVHSVATTCLLKH